MSHSLQCTVLFSLLNCLFSANFLFTISAFVSFFFCFSYTYFNALCMLPLPAFATLHMSWLSFRSTYVSYIISCSSFFGFCGSHLPLRQFVLHCNSKYKIMTGLYDTHYTQMCTLIFAFRSCYCLGSYILQDLFQVSKYFLSAEGQNTKLSVNVFLTCIIFFDAGPSSD